MGSEFDRLCRDVEDMIRSRNAPLKCEARPEVELLRVFGYRTTPLDRARQGLWDVEDLAHTAAEHHPYWRMLNGVAEAARIVLDKWDGVMTRDDLDGLVWAASNLADAARREGSSSGQTTIHA